MVGLWIRLAINETPVFNEAQHRLGQDPERKLPFVAAIRLQGKEVLIAASAMWSDKIERRKVIMIFCTLAVLWALAVLPVMETGSEGPFAFALVVTLIVFGHRVRPGRLGSP